MDVSYEKLFTVHAGHEYFSGLKFTGHKSIPATECVALLHQYGLLIKPEPDGFAVLFATLFEGSHRDRAAVLQQRISLQFHFQITDPSFFEYTANLPGDLAKSIFCFSNFDEQQQAWRTSNLLHTSEFVAESDIKPSADASHYFAHIDIRLTVNLPQDLYIRFLNRATHWRYILNSESFQQFEKLAILGNTNQQLFTGPETMELPAGKKGITFTSAGPIALTQHPDKHFKLVANYNEITGQFERELISKLPCPQLTYAKYNQGNMISEIFIN